MSSALPDFHPSIRRWFDENFAAPTPVQAQSWPLIAAGEHVLATAPTGSGKTLTAFLWALNQFAAGEWAPGQTRVLYVSPLKALNTDIRDNLLVPLQTLQSDGGFPEVRVQTRSGDTAQGERQRMLRRPPEILITTPESLALLLTTRNGQSALSHVQTVILDEVHAVVDNRRGVQLMTSLERLAELAGEFQRLALSATVEPLEPVAAYVGGYDAAGAARPVRIVRAHAGKSIEFRVRFPETVREAIENGRKIWDPLADAFRDVIDANAATLFFTNSRRLAEKITLKINEDRVGPLAYAHHGSLAREIRTAVEQRLKGGELSAIVATSSLEMGIDIGHLDEVVLVQSPPSVAATLQRIGRAGHRVGETSRGSLYPTHAQDFLEAAVLARALSERDIEPLVPLAGCLDVLAQIIISTAAAEEWRTDDLYALLRRAAPYRHLGRAQFELVIEMLAGRYAGSRVRELKPRIAYDRIRGTVRTLKSALFAFYTSGGTIPDRGYYKLRHVDTGAVIGELDEEFVWEAKVGQRFSFGTQHWQVQKITHDDVLVRPAHPDGDAPPFWRAESYNRSFHFSERIGRFLEDAEEALSSDREADLLTELEARRGFEPAAAAELLDYLKRQRAATGTNLPHGHHLLLELVRAGPGGYRGPDQISQLVMHTFWGGRVNRPWAIALATALGRRLDYAPEIHADNNALAIQFKSPIDPAELLSLVRADNFRGLLAESIEGSGFFGARFRECAGRALLLTRARFNQRLPLWMSRLQAKKLMKTVSAYPDFPVLLETWRTCLEDEFDLDHLANQLDKLADGVIRWSCVSTSSPSPFATNITFDQVSRYMYADDSPETDARSSLSDALIADVLAHDRLRPRLAPEVVRRFEEKRQRTHPDYQPAEPDDWREWVKERVLTPVAEYAGPDAGVVRITDGTRRWIAHPEVLDVLTRTGLVAAASVDEPIIPVPDPRSAEELAREILSFYGPRTRAQIEALLPSVPEALLDEENGFIVGQLVEDSEDNFFCDADNYEILLRFQRAALRPDVVAKPAQMLPAFLARWQGFGSTPDPNAVLDALGSLRGFSAPVRVWIQDLLPARLAGISPGSVDQALAEAGLVWFGTGRETMTIAYPEDAALLGTATDLPADSELAIKEVTTAFHDPAARYAFTQLADNQSAPLDVFAERFWRAVWAGRVHADSLTPLRQGLERGFDIAPLGATGAPSRRLRRGALRAAPRGFAGNWQRSPAVEPDSDPLAALETNKERARMLLDRYGVLTRELANREGGLLRWAKLFRALAMMELAGEIVSGYFFEGFSGPQFITPAALQSFLSGRPPGTFWCSAMDPASPAGLGLMDPRLPQRRPQNYLSYLDDELALVVENAGSRLTFHLPPDQARLPETLGPLEHLVATRRRVSVETINGEDARTSPYLTPIGSILKGVKDHKLITLESR
jgi:ATP-dependent Lhr-like helicase